MEILDTEFLEKIEKLRLAVKKIRIISNVGERKSPKTGKGTEFSDYRTYQIGDELRYLDWNIYARFEKFLVKLFEEEEDLEVHILLDSSLSMDFGIPTKFFYGKKLALAFSYLSVSSWEKVTFTYFQDDIKGIIPLERKRENIFKLLDQLNKLKAEGKTNLNEAIKKYVSSLKKKVLLLIISDFLSPYKDGILYARYKKLPVYLIHVISEEEISPPYEGNLQLIDSETNEIINLYLDKSLIENYKKTLDNFLKDIESFSIKTNVEYMRTSTSIPVEDLLLRYLRMGGWLK
jgi:uncharacterized protein (DUF58 family)